MLDGMEHSRVKQAFLELRFFITLRGEFVSRCWYQQMQRAIAQSQVLLLMGGEEWDCCLRNFIIFRREEFIMVFFMVSFMWAKIILSSNCPSCLEVLSCSPLGVVLPLSSGMDMPGSVFCHSDVAGHYGCSTGGGQGWCTYCFAQDSSAK